MFYICVFFLHNLKMNIYQSALAPPRLVNWFGLLILREVRGSAPEVKINKKQNFHNKLAGTAHIC